MPRQRSGRSTDYEWDTFGTSSLALAANATNAVTLISANQPLTVYRIRGELLVWLDAGMAAGDVMRVGSGILKVVEDLGTTVVSSPLADAFVPWMWSYLGHIAAESQTAGADLQGIGFARIPIDSKAMRKMKTGEELQWVVESSTVGGAEVVNFAIAGRILLGS